jgi:spermidine/putrescine transport system ATP-binding protein
MNVRPAPAEPTQPATLVDSPGTDPVAALELIGVSKSYGDVLAVDDLDVAIAQGEFFALLGPSGCGKTSTLKMMAGFEQPNGGEIRLEGEDVTATPPFSRDVNLVFQDYALFPHLNLRDNVAFGLKIKRVSRSERRSRADEMLERMALPGLGDRRIGEISGGQQQRVALARALINHPKVLLLDEPLGALDLKLRRAMQLELKAIQRNVGISFVYVTHDQEEALAMADRIAVMSAGKALQIGGPREIYDHPANRFVADFIGESSFLKGERGAGDGETLGFRLDDGTQIAAKPGFAAAAELAVAMVRPEHTELYPEDTPAPGQGWNQIGATVAELEYAGSDVHYFLDTPSGDRVQSRMPASAQTFVPGSRVQIRFPAARTVLVQAEAASSDQQPDTGGISEDEI